MRPSFFNNTTVEIYEYNDTEAYDDYGNLLGDYVLRETVNADIQPMSVKDNLEQFGKILQDTFKLFLSSDVDVFDTDLLKINGDSYSILGSPENWNHILPFKKLTIQKQRKGD